MKTPTSLPVWLAILSLGVALFAVGCDTVKAPGAASPDPLATEAYPQIAALEGLARTLSFDRPDVRSGPTPPMSVSVPVRLRSDFEKKVHYRFIFFDEHGRPLHPQMGWAYQVLPARAQVFLQASALDTEADDWRLEIRPTR